MNKMNVIQQSRNSQRSTPDINLMLSHNNNNDQFFSKNNSNVASGGKESQSNQLSSKVYSHTASLKTTPGVVRQTKAKIGQ